MGKTTVTFLGTGGVMPPAGSDAASFVINGRYLVDTGHCAAARMLMLGIQPKDIEYLFLTHRHPDHAIGLPQLISYRLGQKFFHPDTEALHAVGPAGDLEELVRLTCRFVSYLNAGAETSSDPALANVIPVPLKPGEKLENDSFQLTAYATFHNPHLKSLAYRFTDAFTGKTIGFTGDTGPTAGLAVFMQKVDLLIHDGGVYPADRNSPGHSSAVAAAEVAAEAGAECLCLIHFNAETIKRAAGEARKTFPRIIIAREGKTVTV
jgi:ribonuclease BN (tRNA processing enzyme)